MASTYFRKAFAPILPQSDSRPRTRHRFDTATNTVGGIIKYNPYVGEDAVTFRVAGSGLAQRPGRFLVLGPHAARRHPPPPSGSACHLPLAGEDKRPKILPRQGEVAPQATEGADSNAFPAATSSRTESQYPPRSPSAMGASCPAHLPRPSTSSRSAVR